MSGRPTRAAFLALAAGLAALPSARAGDGPAGDRPVFFREPDVETARAISRAIERFGLPSPREREQTRDALFDIGYWSVLPLIDTVRDKKASFRSNALLVLGRLQDDRALPPARETLQDNVAEWPPAIAALVLGRFRDGEAATLAAYREALASRENEKRKIAVVLAAAKLHRHRPSEGAALLDQVLATPVSTPFLHYAAILSLGFYRNRVSEPAPDGSGFVPSTRLRAALGDSREGMRLSAVLALAISPQDSFRPIFLEALKDGDRQVRLVALLALARPRRDPDPEVTDLLVSVLEGTKSNGEERRMAAYLLRLRADPRSVDALARTATAPRSPDVAAASLLALAGIEDPRVMDLLLAKLSDRSSTVRAAAAVSLTRLRTAEDLARGREALVKRLQAGEHDSSCRVDMQMAVDEIAKCLRDLEERARGIEPKPRPPVAWAETDARDLFGLLGRTHRQTVFDLVNFRVLQVLGVDGLFEYRPHSEPDYSSPPLPSTEPAPPSDPKGRRMREGQNTGEPWDVRVDLGRRPFFVPEDDPEGVPAPVPKEPR